MNCISLGNWFITLLIWRKHKFLHVEVERLIDEFICIFLSYLNFLLKDWEKLKSLFEPLDRFDFEDSLKHDGHVDKNLLSFWKIISNTQQSIVLGDCKACRDDPSLSNDLWHEFMKAIPWSFLWRAWGWWILGINLVVLLLKERDEYSYDRRNKVNRGDKLFEDLFTNVINVKFLFSNFLYLVFPTRALVRVILKIRSWEVLLHLLGFNHWSREVNAFRADSWSGCCGGSEVLEHEISVQIVIKEIIISCFKLFLRFNGGSLFFLDFRFLFWSFSFSQLILVLNKRVHIAFL